MKPLEHVLSPAVLNMEVSRQTDEEILVWEHKISQSKLHAIKGQNNDTNLTNLYIDSVRPEIKESWLRSKNYGLDFSLYYGPNLDRHSFKQVVNGRKFLLRAADPIVTRLKNIIANTSCNVLLTDEQGVLLYVYSGNKSSTKNYRLEPGVIAAEDTIGTCAHGLSILLKTPMQVWGPEHYSEAFTRCSGSSAPIFDLFGNMVGTLTIGSAQEYHQSSHTLGMVISMAWAIEKQFAFMLENDYLEITMEAAADPILILNLEGKIFEANSEARKLFAATDHSLIGKHIETVIGKQPLIQSLLKTRISFYEIDIENEENKNKYICSAQPINDTYGNSHGFILSFKPHARGKKANSTMDNKLDATSFIPIIGNSPQIKKSVNLAKQIASSDVNLLIQGESGTGKEVFSRTIHQASRPNGPFIAVNCAAIPRSLIESELFGYEAGAFTGAERSGKRGKIELADGGTLFLDEIGDMPLEVQPVLLRVLEERKVMRLGSSQYIPVNFRLITATNKDLKHQVQLNEFRQDLYYRLAVFKIELPPLRDRGLDIITLAEYYILRAAQKLHRPALVLSDQAKSILLEYNWPGNVRELENAILYAVHLCRKGVITPAELPEEITQNLSAHQIGKDRTVFDAKQKFSPIKELEKSVISQALNQTNNQIKEAAKIIGISKSTLYRKIREYNLLDI